MRILYLCADPGVPVFGRKGCSTHVREIARSLMRAGQEVLICCSNRGEDIHYDDGLRIVESKPLTSRALGFDFRHLLYNHRFYASAMKAAETFRPEAIYERFSLHSFTGIRMARKFRLPHLLEINAFLSIEQEKRLHLPWLARASDRYVARRAGQVAVVSEPLRAEVERLGVSRARIHKMPMIASVEQFTPEKPSAHIRERYGLDGKFTMGYVGTLTGWHGINMLYDVADILKDKLPAFAFLVVGGDERKVEIHKAKALQRGLAPYFVFTGSVPYDRVPEHMCALDVALIPDTTYWSSPTKLFEYQASGLPTVAPRYPAIVEAMEDGKEGLLFEAGNAGQFAERLLTLAADPERRQQMGRNARHRILTTHSIDEQVGRVIEIFERMREDLASNGGGGRRP